MLDSGAFSVWNSGKTIQLDDCVAFCLQSPQVAVYVNLDVIPGKGVGVEEAAKQGWQNYRRMIRALPPDKVMPVYHEGEDIRWLHKYLDGGAKYVGLGGFSSDGEKRFRWVSSLRKELSQATLEATKFHGFAVGSCRLMNHFPWYSVDSTTWAKHGQVWQILIPKKKGGKYVYTEEPWVVRLSPRGKKAHQGHFTTLSPLAKQHLMDYLQLAKMPFGSYVVVDVPPAYTRTAGEFWVDTRKKQIVRTVEPGLTTDVNLRNRLNARFYREAVKVAGVSKFYFSAAPAMDWLPELKNILLSFHSVPKGFQRYL